MSRQIPMMYRDPFFREFLGDRDIFGDRREVGFDRPSKIFDQYFGSGMSADDVFVPSSSMYTRCRRPPKERSGVSQVTVEKDKFVLCLDVQQFAPEELKVRVVEGVVEVEAKHEMRQDEHGSVFRHFIRKYTLPDDVVIESVSSSLSPEGVLVIEAPKKPIEPPPPSQRDVPIQKAQEK
ncbi:alpha-crystallin A chain-like [Macrobrachium nipponense]|uniref:alpha-crystallin A chain-like n=1 Tax=Macrobrachium nipponense TaxID=159736 RepID=UPI0030C7FCAE